MPRGTPKKSPGSLMIRDKMKTHWFPLIRPAIRAGYFLGGVALGGAPLDSHDLRLMESPAQGKKTQIHHMIRIDHRSLHI